MTLRIPPNCKLVNDGTAFGVIGVESNPQADNVSLRRAAYHEIGHAICGRLLKFECGGASIRGDGTGSATVAGVLSRHWDLTRGDIMSSVLEKITVCFSGPEAETIVFGSADDRGDRAQIERLARRYFIHDVDVERARERAREILIRHCNMVEVVAAALINRKTLTAFEIDALVELLR